MQPEGPPKETAPGKCYTLWLFENDITTVFTQIFGTAPPNTGGDKIISNAVDGYSCDVANKHYYHSHGILTPVYFELRSLVNVKVSKILLKPRTAPSSGGPFFDNMEARVGNSPGIANFALNTKLGSTMSYSPSPDEFIVFDGSSNPITGTIVMLKKIAFPGPKGFVIIEELKVIGELI